MNERSGCPHDGGQQRSQHRRLDRERRDRGRHVRRRDRVPLGLHQPDEPAAPSPGGSSSYYDSRLNPGSDDYAVTIRYRTNQHFGNIIQKGQARRRRRVLEAREPQRHPDVRVPGPRLERQLAPQGGQLRALRSATAGGTPSGASGPPAALKLTVDGGRSTGPERVDREHLEPPTDLDRRQVQLRPVPDHLRLLHGRHRLDQDRDRLT